MIKRMLERLTRDLIKRGYGRLYTFESVEIYDGYAVFRTRDTAVKFYPRSGKVFLGREDDTAASIESLTIVGGEVHLEKSNGQNTVETTGRAASDG